MRSAATKPIRWLVKTTKRAIRACPCSPPAPDRLPCPNSRPSLHSLPRFRHTRTRHRSLPRHRSRWPCLLSPNSSRLLQFLSPLLPQRLIRWLPQLQQRQHPRRSTRSVERFRGSKVLCPRQRLLPPRRRPNASAGPRPRWQPPDRSRRLLKWWCPRLCRRGIKYNPRRLKWWLRCRTYPMRLPRRRPSPCRRPLLMRT